MGISTELNTGLITFSKVFHRLVENFAHRPGISKNPLEKAVDNLTDKQRNTQRCGLFVENCQGEFIFFSDLAVSSTSKVCYTSKVCLKRALFLNGRFNKETKKISC
jgi:hypothetical protein